MRRTSWQLFVIKSAFCSVPIWHGCQSFCSTKASRSCNNFFSDPVKTRTLRRPNASWTYAMLVAEGKTRTKSASAAKSCWQKTSASKPNCTGCCFLSSAALVVRKDTRDSCESCVPSSMTRARLLLGSKFASPISKSSDPSDSASECNGDAAPVRRAAAFSISCSDHFSALLKLQSVTYSSWTRANFCAMRTLSSHGNRHSSCAGSTRGIWAPKLMECRCMMPPAPHSNTPSPSSYFKTCL